MNTPNNQEFDLWLEDFVTGLIERIGLDIWVEEVNVDDQSGHVEIQLEGPDKARVIGRDGHVLDALQHIAVSASSNAGFSSQRFLIDVSHYRSRREDRVKEEAERLAREALETGEPRDFEPMSPRERRLVHMTLAQFDGVTTVSEGMGEERYVRVLPRT